MIENSISIPNWLKFVEIISPFLMAIVVVWLTFYFTSKREKKSFVLKKDFEILEELCSKLDEIFMMYKKIGDFVEKTSSFQFSKKSLQKKQIQKLVDMDDFMRIHHRINSLTLLYFPTLNENWVVCYGYLESLFSSFAEELNISELENKYRKQNYEIFKKTMWNLYHKDLGLLKLKVAIADEVKKLKK